METNVFGYAGLCDLLECTKPTAWKILKSGALDSAVSRIGRKIVINREAALQLLTKKSKCTY